MSGGGGEGKSWIGALVVGSVLVVAAMVAGSSMPEWLDAGLEGLGGLLVIFGACESMIKSVDGLARRLNMNEFVAGTLAGLASNIPELVMLGFVLAATPRVGFIVTALTLHVGPAAFGIYSALLPRDERGAATMPPPLVELSTDLYACAGGAFFTTGGIMLLMHAFETGGGAGAALGVGDLYALGGALLFVEVVSVTRLVKRFGGSDEKSVSAAEGKGQPLSPPPSVATIVGYGILGIGSSVLGGHAVGDFADVLVGSLAAAGYPRMVGALVLSIFASAGAFIMVATAHMKGMYDVALANASGQVSQVPFVVLPVALILLAVFGQTGVIPLASGGGVLPIDLDATSVLLLGFPAMLILWKAVQDDGKVNWLETATMVAIFGLTIYFLAVHG